MRRNKSQLCNFFLSLGLKTCHQKLIWWCQVIEPALSVKLKEDPQCALTLDLPAKGAFNLLKKQHIKQIARDRYNEYQQK